MENKTELSFEEIFHSGLDAVFITDERGLVCEINRAGVSLFNIERSSAIGINMKELFSDSSCGEELFCRCREQVISGNDQALELQFVRTGDRDYLPLLVSMTKINNGGDALILVSVRDLTEVKSREARFRGVDKQLDDSRKREAVALFARITSHDFSNCLGGIFGGAELLRMKMDPSLPYVKYVDMIIESAESTTELSDRFLAFAKTQRTGIATISIAAPLEDAICFFKTTDKNQVSIQRELPEQQIFVKGTSSYIRDAFLDLILHTAHNLTADQEIFINLQETELSDVAGLDLKPGLYAEVEIRGGAKGPGDESPFQGPVPELKSVYIAFESLGGAVMNQRGGGGEANFRVLIPVADMTACAEESKSKSCNVRSRESILIIDKDFDVLNMATSALESKGYRVTPARNGQEGVDIFSSDPERFDLVFLDEQSPKVSGINYYSRLRRISPEQKIILSARLAESVEEPVQTGFTGVINKPFSSAELEEYVREILDA